MDPTQQAFIDTFREFLEGLNAERQVSRTTPLGELVAAHLGLDVDQVPLVTEPIKPHRLVDTDVAVVELAATDPEARLIGVGGGMERAHQNFSEMLSSPHMAFTPGPVSYVETATGPTQTRQVVAFGLHLFSYGGEPVAVLQRTANPEYGRDDARLEVLTPSATTSAALLADIRRLMRERSVLKGQVLSFGASDFRGQASGTTFVERPRVAEVDVVLPPGTLDRIVGHVVDIGRHREALVAAGRHLKRGVLLYGPPGTGKTLTVRHLIARTVETTVVLLTGPAIAYIGEATELARALQPAMVVLEDIDLIALDRDSYGPQPLLFTLLDALDGLDADADVAFVMTTNRVELLEKALAERPGRVDLAVSIDLPDAAARTRLFALYAHGLPLSPDALERAAARSTGMTASFAKELMRRVVLSALESETPITDATLDLTLDQLLSSQEDLTRARLGASHPTPDPTPND